MVVLLLLVPYTWSSPWVFLSAYWSPPRSPLLLVSLFISSSASISLDFIWSPFCSPVWFFISPYRIVLFTTVASLSLPVLENALPSKPCSMFILFLFPSCSWLLSLNFLFVLAPSSLFSPVRGNLVDVRCHSKERAGKAGKVAEAPYSFFCMTSHSWSHFPRLLIESWKNNWFTDKGLESTTSILLWSLWCKSRVWVSSSQNVSGCPVNGCLPTK